ncbi:MAG: hypothetical protein H6Q00_195 [Holophagaceae bacterium]|nr:hypothetical protein [Holophagaceae bacterium]
MNTMMNSSFFPLREWLLRMSGMVRNDPQSSAKPHKYLFTAKATTALALALLLSCGGGSPGASTPPSEIQVTVSPGVATLTPGGTTLFIGTVTGTSNTALDWSVDGIPNGNSSVGTLTIDSSTATYTAPATTGSHSIIATSMADTSRTGLATATILAKSIQLTISPETQTLNPRETAVFIATVTGLDSTELTWTVDGITNGNSTVGTISGSGTAVTYTAPSAAGSHTLMAASVSDKTQLASASVTVRTYPTNPFQIIVAPDGVETNPGTLAQPTTLEGAQARLRSASRSVPGTLTVLLRGGIYPRSNTFALSSVDSGTAANPIIYAAYGSEVPRLVGGIALTPQSLATVTNSDVNWSRLDTTVRAKIMVADLSSVKDKMGSFTSRLPGNGGANRAMELFVDRMPMNLAQYPKAVDPSSIILTPHTPLRVTGTLSPDATGDYAYIADDSMGRPYYQLSKNGEIWSIAALPTGATWFLTNRADLGGTGTGVSWGNYENFSGPVGRFEPTKTDGLTTGTALLTRADGQDSMPGFMLIHGTDGSTQIQSSLARISRWQANEAMYYGAGSVSWSTSHMSISDIDGPAGTIKLGATPTYGLRVGQPFIVYNLLEELTAQGDYYLDRTNGLLYLRPPEDTLPEELLLSTLPSLVTMQGVSYISWQGIVFEAAQNHLVEVENSSNIQFSHCTFRNCGGWGLLLAGTSNLVDSCEVSRVGSGGIWACGGSRPTLSPSNTLIQNCNIHHYGRVFGSYQPGIYVQSTTDYTHNDDCCGLTIQHNEIHHAPCQAIIYQGNNLTLQYNHIHDVCQLTNDAGAIYSQRDWASQGNAIRRNLIRSVASPFGNYVQAIYLDTGGSGTIVEANILYQGGAIMSLQHNGGRDVVMRYNVIYGGWFGAQTANYSMTRLNSTPGSSFNLLEKLEHFNYQQPPWSTTYPTLAVIPDDWSQLWGTHWLQPENCSFYGNLFYGNSTDIIRETNVYPSMASPLSWFTIVSDNLNQDPQFTDPASLDFSLKSTSPMFTIPGFPGIDASEIGIQP